MKRLIALMLAALLCLTAMPALAEQAQTLTVWIPQYQFSEAEDAISDIDFWTAQFEEFEATYNCEVNIEILPWGDYNTPSTPACSTTTARTWCM